MFLFSFLLSSKVLEDGGSVCKRQFVWEEPVEPENKRKEENYWKDFKRLLKSVRLIKVKERFSLALRETRRR